MDQSCWLVRWLPVWKALISKPGGDKIGRRRLDTHFIGIQKLGACFNYDEERSVFSICAEHLEGTYMLLDEASVTGTANIVMASVLAKGKTTIYNAACGTLSATTLSYVEPHGGEDFRYCI